MSRSSGPRDASIRRQARARPSRTTGCEGRRDWADTGAAAVLILLLTPAVLALGGLLLDGGTALAARQRSADLAEQAARAGADTLDTGRLRATGTDAVDPGRAAVNACRYVAVVEPAASCSATVTATFAAGVRGAQQVQVQVRTSTPTVLLGLIGVNRLHTDGTATAEAVTGIVTGRTVGGGAP